MKHVVMMSGGTGSWAAGRRVADKHGTADLILLFADTNSEDPDLYRFLRDAARDIGGQLVTIDNGGRSIWDVFREQRFLGNTRVDPCSKYLKRMPMRKWLQDNCDPAETVCYLGIDWSESHRMARAAAYWSPWAVRAPLCESPYIDKQDIADELARRGIAIPALTRDGFPHNNCGGGCVKAGQGHFRMLMEKRPAVFAEWEAREAELRTMLGDVAILRDRTGGQTRPLPLSVLRRRVTGGEPIDEFDIGGCACAVGDIDEDRRTLEAVSA